tara:strand:- start:116 stop:451 length:336 start_codon:yes stop_codon:yes gene_type:complete
MANLQKHRSHESLNVDSAAEWNVQTRLTISSQAHVASNVTNVSQIGIHSDSACHFRFDNLSSDTIVVNNDLQIPANTMVFLKVPQGISGDIYVHFKQVASVGSKFLRIVHL